MNVIEGVIGLGDQAGRVGLQLGAAILASALACGIASAGGQLDDDYGVGGYFLDPPVGEPGGAATGPVSAYTDVVIAEGGELYAVGFGSGDTCRVVAVTAAGARNPAWGGDAAAGFPCWTQGMGPAIALQDDGRVIVGSAGDRLKLQLRRWSADGTPDATFGNGGIATIDLPIVPMGEAKMQAAPDRSIVVAIGGRQGACPGHFCEDEPARLILGRLGPDGGQTAAWSDLEPPDRFYIPAIAGIVASAGGEVTIVIEGSSNGHNSSMTLVQVAADGTLGTRVARWTDSYGQPAFALAGGTVYVADYDDDEGGSFLHRYDLVGNHLGDPVRLESVHGTVTALAIGPSGNVHVVEQRYDRQQDSAWFIRDFVRTYQPGGQPEPSFAAAGIDHGASLDAWELRAAPAGRLTVAAFGGGRLGAMRVSLGNGGHAGRVGMVRRLTNLDTGSFAGSSNDYYRSTTINQRDTTLDFVVDRTGGSDGAVSVAYRIDGNAAATGAFVPATGRLDWAAGETASKTMSLTLVSADPVEDGARVELSLSDPTGGATIGSATHVVHVLAASPGRLGLPGFDGDVQGFREGQRVAIAVSRHAGGNGSVSVRLRRVYVSRLGQAAGPADFSGPDDVVLSWADGETGARLYELDVVDDRMAEPREYVRLELSEATDGAVIESATVEIAIDDSGSHGGGDPPPASGGSGGGGGAVGLVASLALALLSVAAGPGRRRRPLTRCSEA